MGCGVYTAVDETVARLLRLMQHMPRGGELVWHTKIPSDLAVEMDPHDFGEVMGNLIDNARKWARSTVTIRAECLGKSTRITVEDDGPGFSGRIEARRPGAWHTRPIRCAIPRGSASASSMTSLRNIPRADDRGRGPLHGLV